EGQAGTDDRLADLSGDLVESRPRDEGGVVLPVDLASRSTAGRDCAIAAEREAPDVANAGLVRPPFVYLSAILVGSVLQIAWPLHFLPSGSRRSAWCWSSRRRRCSSRPCGSSEPRERLCRATVEHDNRRQRPLSLQPGPDLGGVLAAAAR